MQPTTRTVTIALVALAALAVAMTVAMRVQAGHPLAPMYYAPVAALLGCLAVWPFAVGWRPFGPGLRHCPACRAEWRPGEDGAVRHCPACGA